MLLIPDMVFMPPSTFGRLFNEGRISFAGRNIPIFENKVVCVSDEETEGVNEICTPTTARSFIAHHLRRWNVKVFGDDR